MSNLEHIEISLPTAIGEILARSDYIDQLKSMLRQANIDVPKYSGPRGAARHNVASKQTRARTAASLAALDMYACYEVSMYDAPELGGSVS